MTGPVRIALVCGALLGTGCGGGAGGGTAQLPLTTANLAAVKLQFAVGTVTAFETAGNGGAPLTALNFVETLRQTNGLTGLLQDTATISGPSTFMVGMAPAYDGGAPNVISNSFGNVYAYGFGFGGPGSTTGYGKPTSAGMPGQVTVQLGGPPAFPRVNDGNFPAGFSGYSLGIFAYTGPQNGLVPAIGSYTLDVATPAGSSQTFAWQATAKLATLTQLPAIATPTLTFDGQGGGSVTFVVPPRVSEVFVNLAAGSEYCYPLNGQTQAQAQAAVFTLFVRATGAAQLTVPIPDNLGPPSGNASLPTFCSAAQNAAADPNAATGGATVNAQIVGVDYPLYEAAYPQSRTQTPVIAGTVDPDGNSNPQADVTLSPTLFETSP